MCYFSPNLAFLIWLAGEICVWRVADFWLFSQDFGGKFGGFLHKI